MCKKTQFKYCPSKIDPCIMGFMIFLNRLKLPGGKKIKTLACCCGHGKYPMTIVCKDSLNNAYDIISDCAIPRKRKFYKKDSEGYYYIPEVSEPKNKTRIRKTTSRRISR